MDTESLRKLLEEEEAKISPDELHLFGTEPETPKNETVKLKIGDQEVSGSTPEELQTNIDEYLASLDQQPAGAVNPAALGGLNLAPAPEPEKPKERPQRAPFELKSWSEQFIADPVAGHKALMGHAGYEDQLEDLSSKLEAVEQVKQEQAVVSAQLFVDRAQDFPVNDPQATGLLGAVARRLPGGITLQNLNTSWAQLKAMNAIQPIEPEKEPEKAKAKLPPSVGGNHSGEGVTDQQKILANFMNILNEKGVEAAEAYAEQAGLDREGSITKLNGGLPAA